MSNSKRIGHNSTYAGPSARRLARELGISIDKILGTANDGRISCNDVRKFIQEKPDKSLELTVRRELPGFEEQLVTRESLTGISKVTAANMTNAWERIPHAWLQIKADINDLETYRQNWNLANEQRLSMTCFLVKALAETMIHFPKFNACYDELAEQIVYKGDINIGLAVDTPRGLLVPVIRQVDSLSIGEISQQINEFSEKGKKNRISPQLLKGGGMTLSSLGSMEINALFPIVNWPEVAILGVGTIDIDPRWDGTVFLPRKMINLVLGFDHRIINGADGARFLNYLKQLLESPILLALNSI